MENKNFEEWINLDGVEEARVYHFGNDVTYSISKPVRLFVKKSGSHKLVDDAGRLHYIKNTWVAFSAIGEWKINIT